LQWHGVVIVSRHPFVAVIAFKRIHKLLHKLMIPRSGYTPEPLIELPREINQEYLEIAS
jgi:hypothetical protein